MSFGTGSNRLQNTRSKADPGINIEILNEFTQSGLVEGMNKSSIIREGYVYKEERKVGQLGGVFYFVLKTNVLCFHRRKVHRRHTPLGSLKLEEICTEIRECNEDDTQVDSNANYKRFSWQIVYQNRKLFLFCATEEERSSWITAILEAKKTLCSVSVPPDSKNLNILDKSDNLMADKQEGLTVVLQGSCNLHTAVSKSVDNSSHTEEKSNNSVGIGEVPVSVCQKTPIRRRRSRSLSELISIDSIENQVSELRSAKSKSAPPVGGTNKRAFTATVDKLIDVQSVWCRQLVRWI